MYNDYTHPLPPHPHQQQQQQQQQQAFATTTTTTTTAPAPAPAAVSWAALMHPSHPHAQAASYAAAQAAAQAAASYLHPPPQSGSFSGQQQQQQHTPMMMTMAPPPPPPGPFGFAGVPMTAPPAKTLYNCEVGELANVVRNHAHLGQYASIPTNTLTFFKAAQTETIEAGRLAVREQLFYAELGKIFEGQEKDKQDGTGSSKDKASSVAKSSSNLPPLSDTKGESATSDGDAGFDENGNAIIDPQAELERLLISRLSGEPVFKKRLLRKE